MHSRKRTGVLQQVARAVTTANAQPENRVLAERHRVILGGWPIAGAVAAKDRRVATLGDLLDHVVEAGYDGVELGVQGFKGFFPPQTSVETVIRSVQAEASQRGVEICGDLFIVSDSESAPMQNLSALDFADPELEAKLAVQLRQNAALGCEYATFQISLPERHMHTGGEYRNDDAFLTLCAERIGLLQSVCHKMGQNFYVETHMDRISEDLEAFAKIMERAPAFEVNADLSHYIHRGIKTGTTLQLVLGRVGHMHQRMAQTYGDLSSDVSDPVADWQNPNGATRTAWEMAKMALRGGLTSRCIMGETGPMNNVDGTRTLDLDASLVPLYRLMANYADEEISAINPFAPTKQKLQPVSGAVQKQAVNKPLPNNDVALAARGRLVDTGDPPEDPSIKHLWELGTVPGSKNANSSVTELVSQVSTAEAQEALSGLIGFAFARWPASFLWRGPHVPAIQVFKPTTELKTGAAMIIAPGGGYSILPPHEGDAVAEWLADHGVTAFLLRHRLIPYGYPIPTPAGDMQRAIRYVRHHAADLEIDPHRVGVLGISAGGHCASSAATMFCTDIFPPVDAIDTESCRPDLCVLVYPLTCPAKFSGWVENKVGSFGSEDADTEAQNTARLVTVDTPPTFIAHSTGDMSLRVADHADPYWAALQANGVDCEYVRSDFGAHGCGLVEVWGAPCIEWLASRQFASPKASSEYIYDFLDGAMFFSAVEAQ